MCIRDSTHTHTLTHTHTHTHSRTHTHTSHTHTHARSLSLSERESSLAVPVTGQLDRLFKRPAEALTDLIIESAAETGTWRRGGHGWLMMWRMHGGMPDTGLSACHMPPPAGPHTGLIPSRALPSRHCIGDLCGMPVARSWVKRPPWCVHDTTCCIVEVFEGTRTLQPVCYLPFFQLN